MALKDITDQNFSEEVLKSDDNPDTATHYHISGIPSLLLFKQGEVADQIVGAVPKTRLVDMVGKHV